jgi:hypothetical protein
MMSELFFDIIANDLEMPATIESTSKVVVETTNSEDFLYGQCYNGNKIKQGTVQNDINNIKKVEQIFEQELENYFKYITSIDYDELIRNYPSKFYDEKTFKPDQVLIVKDPLYTAHMFDVFGWWQQYGRNKFRFLELCAMIVFDKPVDNGFQECVFSIGTFTDDQL